MYITRPLLYTTNAFSRGPLIFSRYSRIIPLVRQYNKRPLSQLKYGQFPAWRRPLVRISSVTLPLSFCRHNFTQVFAELDLPKHVPHLPNVHQPPTRILPQTTLQRLLNAIASFLSDYIIEPILISWRFSYLTLLFLPVILTSPMMLIGERVEEHGCERSGTLWWYNFLVRQMETAGPTFIKVYEINAKYALITDNIIDISMP
jgi:hypothetical protein